MSDPTKEWLKEPDCTADFAKDLEQEHRERNADNKALLSFYWNRFNTADRSPSYDHREVYEAIVSRSGENLLRELLDATAAQVCRPMQAQVESVGGDARVLRSCKMQNRILDGVYDSTKFKRIAKRAYRDSLVTDIGAFMWTLTKGGEFRCERLNPLYVLWPMSKHSEVRTLVYVDEVPRDRLMAMYPGQAEAIKDLPEYQHETIEGVHLGMSSSRPGRSCDTVKVVTAYATALEGEDEEGKPRDVPGRYVIACENGLVLKNVEWPHRRHPIVACRWDWAFEGFAGTSLASVIVNYHVAVNRHAIKEDEFLEGAKPAVIVEESVAADANWSDRAYQKIVIPDGAKEPKIVVPNVVPKEILESSDRRRVRAAAEAGVSQALAAGQGPSGITSGRGLREYVVIANQRQADQHEVWSDIHVDGARVVVMLGSAYKTKAIRTRAPGTKWLEEVKWLDSKELRESEYEIKYNLVSGLSQTTAGKLEDISAIRAQAPSLIDDIDVLRRLEVPDFQSLADTAAAPREYVEHILDSAFEDGVTITPTVMQGDELQALYRKGLQRLSLALLPGKNTPWKNIEAGRKVIRLTQQRLGLLQAPPAPEAGTPAVGDPNAAPAPGGLSLEPPPVMQPGQAMSA